MAEDSIIVADGGDFVGSAAYIMRYAFRIKTMCKFIKAT